MSLIVIAAIPVTLLLLQLGLYLLAGLVNGGDDALESTLTPLKLLAANISTGLTALLGLVLVSSFARVPWRSVFSSPRHFDRRRLAVSFAGSAVLVGAGTAVVAVVARRARGDEHGCRDLSRYGQRPEQARTGNAESDQVPAKALTALRLRLSLLVRLGSMPASQGAGTGS